MAKRKDYFPNNWKEYKDADDSMFIEHRFDELMEWKAGSWELPSSVYCIIRSMDLDTKKVREYVYQGRNHAQQRVNKLINDPNVEFFVVDHESLHHIAPPKDV